MRRLFEFDPEEALVCVLWYRSSSKANKLSTCGAGASAESIEGPDEEPFEFDPEDALLDERGRALTDRGDIQEGKTARANER